MFADWDNYYLIIGSAAGALIGLMFVVATLSAGLDSRMLARGTRVYYTPIVFDFTIVVIVSAISAIPRLPDWATIVLVAACAIAGFVYTAATTRRVLEPNPIVPVHRTDKWFYGYLPAVGYLVLGTVTGLAAAAPEPAVYGIAAVMLLLLLLGIRNAWDLATFLVQRPFEQPEQKAD